MKLEFGFNLIFCSAKRIRIHVAKTGYGQSVAPFAPHIRISSIAIVIILLSSNALGAEQLAGIQRLKFTCSKQTLEKNNITNNV